MSNTKNNAPSIIAVVGESGTGKSTSFRNLDPETTFIARVINKPLPFRGARSKYIEGKNTQLVDNWMDVIKVIKKVNDDPKFKTLVIDDLGHIMSIEFLNRAQEVGYDKFTEIGQHVFYILKKAEKCREDLKVVFTFHPEIIRDSDGVVSTKIRTIGKLLDEKYTLEGSFTHIFYSVVIEDQEGIPQYKFVTNRVRGYPAKTSLGMFDELYIDNDFSKIFEIMDNFEKGV